MVALDEVGFLRHVRQQFLEIEGLFFQHLPLLIGPRQKQQPLDQGFHIFRFGADGGYALVQRLLILAAPAAQHIRIAQHDRDRRAQLMGSVGNEPPLLLKSGFQAVQHVVDGLH